MSSVPFVIFGANGHLLARGLIIHSESRRVRSERLKQPLCPLAQTLRYLEAKQPRRVEPQNPGAFVIRQIAH